MDEINDFFDFSKPCVRKTIAGGFNNGRLVDSNKIKIGGVFQERKNPENRAHYADKYERLDEELAKDLSDKCSMTTQLDDMDEVSSVTDSQIEYADAVYSKYNFENRTHSDLPIKTYRKEILRMLDEHSILVLQGATGCGKTTQVPQFLLDDAQSKMQRCNIVVTQPRRIAAISNAERVAAERNWPIRSVVGYQIGLDARANCSEDTRILFCTTGVLLEKLIRSKELAPYSHIILDEVHERNKDMDFLLIIIRKLLNRRPRPKVKIILMSATIDAHQFANYFKVLRNDNFIPAPIINVNKKQNFQVGEYYFDEIRSLLPNSNQYDLPPDDPEIPDIMYLYPVKLVNIFDRFDDTEREAGVDLSLNANPRPSVLIFLPGIQEIHQMQKTLETHWDRINTKTKLQYIILHSMLSDHHRGMAMKPAADGVRKIILATNIAESSITVPDVKYVIDFCLTRNLVLDTNTNFAALRMDWASRNNCRQRAGRTGRVMNGRCYRLVTKGFYDCGMRESPIPEILSSPLENIILKTKLLDMGSPESILALAMDKPALSDIGNSILQLKQIGALLQTCDGAMEEMDGDISFIGRVMANLPIDVKIAKLIILGYCFSMLEECIIIGSALNTTKPLFKHVQGKEGILAYTQIIQWSNGSGSDLFALLNVFTIWTKLHNEKAFGTDHTLEHREKMKKDEKDWADRHFVELSALYECYQQKSEIEKRLQGLGICQRTGVNRVQWTNNEKAIILKVIIAGAFYPNIFSRTSSKELEYERSVFSVIAGRDVRNTVYYSGFEQKYLRDLYIQPIKQLFVQNGIVDSADLANVRITFDEGSQKVFVTFLNGQRGREEHGVASLPGNILTEVYTSIKMRSLKLPSKICVIRQTETARRIAHEKGLEYKEDRYSLKSNANFLDKNCLPSLMDKNISGYITYVENCNRFWFQPTKQYDELKVFNQIIKVIPIDASENILVGQNILVELPNVKKDIKYFRGRVLAQFDGPAEYRVKFIDYGNVENVSASSIRRVPKGNIAFLDLPPQCFQCNLAKIKPSTMSSDEYWDNEAKEIFQHLTVDRELTIEIYSVVNGVANVFVPDAKDRLIKQGFAEDCEENYMSRENNAKRQYVQSNGENCETDEHNEFLEAEAAIEVEAPSKAQCNLAVKLNGPKSPIETTLCGITEAAKAKTISIDGMSINSVLLDNDPQESMEKYLVAASVIGKGTNRSLALRQTTLMPNIRCFGPLMAMIFSPCVQVQHSKDKTRYVSLLSGLGYNFQFNRPIYEEHDATFDLDHIIDKEDFEIANQIRYTLDTLLWTYAGQEKTENVTDHSKIILEKKIKDLILRLLSKVRLPSAYESGEHKWNSYDPKDVLTGIDVYRERAIFPSHAILKLHKEDAERLQFLRKHCKELHRFAQLNRKLPREIKCQLCSQMISTLADLRIHLNSYLHLNRQKQINFD